MYIPLSEHKGPGLQRAVPRGQPTTVRRGAGHPSWGGSTSVLLKSQFSESPIKKLILWWAPVASWLQTDPHIQIKMQGTTAVPCTRPHWSPQASSGDVFRIMITVI